MSDRNFAVQRFSELLETARFLLGPNGCPWDREQTHLSLRKYLLEECAECLDAIDSEDPAELREELGDVLLQVLLHGLIAEKAHRFSLQDVFSELNEKLIRRHPHVFEEKTEHDAENALSRWEAIKAKEKSKQDRHSALDGIPHSLSGLSKAAQLGKKAARHANFDWKALEGVWKKVEEELDELKAAQSLTQTQVESELGDVLFSISQLARHLGIDPEGALQMANKRFIARFTWMEAHSSSPLDTLRPEEQEALWQDAKNKIG